MSQLLALIRVPLVICRSVGHGGVQAERVAAVAHAQVFTTVLRPLRVLLRCPVMVQGALGIASAIRGAVAVLVHLLRRAPQLAEQLRLIELRDVDQRLSAAAVRGGRLARGGARVVVWMWIALVRGPVGGGRR